MKLPEPDTHCFDEDEQKDVWSYSKELVQQIVKDEREACAKACDALAHSWRGAASQCIECAVAIRARNKS